MFVFCFIVSLDSSVAILTRLHAGRLRNHGSIPARGTAFRLSLEPTQLPVQWVSVNLPPGIRRTLREDDDSPSSTLAML
jgi:hypothetical protein